jgi:DNA-binding IclR family transcriptional regulator
MVLERHRLIEKNPNNGKYRLGLKLFELGTKAIGQLDLRERARPFLERAVLETGETVHLCVYDQGEVVYLDKLEPERSVRLTSSVGRRNPAYCTAVGKAIMAFLPLPEVEIAVKRHGFSDLTRKTISNMLELKADLIKVRKLGYAVDDEEHEEGVICVGAPVWDFGHHPIAAISVSGPAFRMTPEKLPVVAQSVLALANALSKQIGMRAVPPRVEDSEDKDSQVVGA